MAKIDKMPSQAIIDDFGGVIDFYVYKGQPCARKWPTWRRRKATGAELANQMTFAYAIKSWNELSQYIREMYFQMAAGTTMAPRDLFVRSYMKGSPFLHA